MSTTQITLAKAMTEHLLLPGDNKIAQFKGLTPEDKADLREQFAREFGYQIITT